MNAGPPSDVRLQEFASFAISRKLTLKATSGLLIDTLRHDVYHHVYTNRILRRTPDDLKEDSALHERE